MSNDPLTQALAECRAWQPINRQEEERRLQEVRAACPEIAQLMDERREGIMAGIRLALKGVADNDLPARTQAINDRIDMLLAQNGFSQDYLDPIYHCAQCRDTGYMGEQHKTICPCVRAKSLGTHGSDTASFETYDETVFPDTLLPGLTLTQRAYMGGIKRICQEYADQLPQSRTQNLFLTGSSGLGKTFLLRAIAKRATERGILTAMYTANDLLNRIRADYFAREFAPDNDLYTMQLLLIDDLGTEPLWENITVEQLFALIDARLTRGVHTVISTNLTPGEVQARYTERIASRLFDRRTCQALRFLGTDVRKRA
ncbi:MAG: ATP-binding protein [Christensenellales bacterium]|jgi:DNA replication protein DnaC